MRMFFATLALIAGLTPPAAAQVVQGSGVGSSLRVTVLDPTDAALIIAQVSIVDSRGVEQSAVVDDHGVALFENLSPGTYQVKAQAESFRPLTTPYTVRRGENRTTLRLALATIEQAVVVEEKDSGGRGDNGFTQTLTQEEIDSLPDDPEEMAEELQRMAGPGAQIFVNGFRGGRLPPKDQIQQIRFHTNSFSAEYHEAGMIRVEVITKPGLGGWRGHTNFGFRDESLNATNAFAKEKGPEQMRRYMVNFQGPIAKGKTGFSMSFDGNSAYDSRTIVAQSPAGQVNELAVAPSCCSTRALKFIASVGATASSFTCPVGDCATMVRESYELLPSNDMLNPVLPLAIGPWKFTMYRRICSGPFSFANAFVAFSDSSRKPKLVWPRQPPSPGLVITSTRIIPAS